MNPQPASGRGLHLPSAATVIYLKDLITLGLLLLALPWIVYRLFTDPTGLMKNREAS